MCICDLSSKNPNVLYELGIRQAFNLPVCLIKDDLTSRIFDIQGFRDCEYSSSLRIDEVQNEIDIIAANIKSTYSTKETNINSLVSLLGVSTATLEANIHLSPEITYVTEMIKDLTSKITNLQERLPNTSSEIHYINQKCALAIGDNAVSYTHLARNSPYSVPQKVGKALGTVCSSLGGSPWQSRRGLPTQ